MDSKFENNDKRHGRQDNQKMKSLLVWNFLCRHTDEDHFATANDIVGYLKENGIFAERRSIYTDVEQLNKVMYMIENDCSLEEAEEDLEYDPECAIIKLKPKKGYYVQHQNYDFDSIRLIIESIYSAKFVDDAQMDELVSVVSNLLSDNYTEKLEHSVLNIDHVRTDNKDTFFNVSVINDAMSKRLEGVPHTAEKISFHYMRYSINDMRQSVARQKGRKYIVSPYQLILSDGNYYLLCFDDQYQKIRTYRVDRMKDVERLGIARDGEEQAKAINTKEYTKRVFSMYGGKTEHVRLQFANYLLDTVIEKFGKDKLKYHQIDDHHFSVLTEVEISPQFFAWLCGFGASVKILDPPEAKNQYKEYLNKIMKVYE